MNARRHIVLILAQIDRHPGCMERIVDQSLDRARLDHRDKRFVFEIVYGIVRRRLTLDYIIGPLLDNAQLRKNETLRRILRLGLYQLIYMDRVPDHAAVNETVALAKQDPETRALAGVVNGVLRKVTANRKAMTPDCSKLGLGERLSIEYSHPVWLIDRWLAHFGLARTKRLLAFNNERPAIYLRRKIRDVPRQQFEAEVRSICEPATGYMNLYYRLKKNALPENLWVIRDGLCNVQSPSSGWVVALMEAGKGDKVLDVCSSPGGKSALLSELVGAGGSLCAGDNKWNRILLVKDTVKSLKLKNVHPLVFDGIHSPFTGVFDKVLLDVPCSATGVMHRHPEARWTRDPADIQRLSEAQHALLDAATLLVAPGGTLVYSTCSIEPEENQAQAERFLSGHAQFEHIGCPREIPQTYVDSKGYLSITPFDHGIDGMFGARFRKK
ncbi:MAG: 16S rRNA (cytosine(967)-C(5))-methyltransferase RsmB [Chitinispirillaceae bacterium]|nr:16S rRNA (cytosine(967)-C(5))-methyltransferase RsmB [Chitinispirillaceae bacterium]